ncbi:tyrosine--tRNA ligase, mitochondrial-like [Pollicipes pollicipes]|uniref:tyrosine--tRNA ligase, mitochondrial-like n=1 Tax=Pollicipes pollicipes TaxID=41117 RepID=UPI0018851671|nr:tyrosine--tRNA ligase, mitochondrial-like [Pollicipes pollicipes]XP_037093567.1 tyrosine--tRNA ligase, mitochondrial-like [Pollicipes pollicipes]
MLRILRCLGAHGVQQRCTARNIRGARLRWYSSRNLTHLKERGLLSEVFPDDSKRLQDVLNASTQCFYSGFDPTADSLHVGNLLVLVALLHCQRAGHEVVTVIGGATGQIGDPSGRRTERAPLDPETTERNVAAIEENVRRVFTNHERHFWTEHGHTDPLTPLRVLNNADWYSEYSLVDFLSIIGRRLRMSNMLSRTSVQSRLSSTDGMSFTEFTYQMFQAYDWLYLWRKHGCCFQVGGTDQRGNMLSGYELVTGTTDEQVDLFGLTVPLVTTEEGDKLGKSAGNTVWLDAERTSPFDLYQYWVRRGDGDVERLLRLFTFLPPADIDQIMTRHRASPESRLAQKKLAESVTMLVHGADGLRSAKRVTHAIYSRDPEALVGLADAELRAMFRHSPVTELMLTPGLTVQQLAMAAGCFSRDADAARIIEAGGLHINQRRVASTEEVVTADSHVLPNGLTLIRVGKKNFYIVKWV